MKEEISKKEGSRPTFFEAIDNLPDCWTVTQRVRWITKHKNDFRMPGEAN